MKPNKIGEQCIYSDREHSIIRARDTTCNFKFYEISPLSNDDRESIHYNRVVKCNNLQILHNIMQNALTLYCMGLQCL